MVRMSERDREYSKKSFLRRVKKIKQTNQTVLIKFEQRKTQKLKKKMKNKKKIACKLRFFLWFNLFASLQLV